MAPHTRALQFQRCLFSKYQNLTVFTNIYNVRGRARHARAPWATPGSASGMYTDRKWWYSWHSSFCLHRQSAYACSDSAPDPNLLRGLKLWIPRTDWLPSLFTRSYVVIDPRDYHGNHALSVEAFWLVTCQIAAKTWIQIFQTSLACRNNHRRNGVRPRK
jgi:hypothetical protein